MDNFDNDVGGEYMGGNGPSHPHEPPQGYAAYPPQQQQQEQQHHQQPQGGAMYEEAPTTNEFGGPVKLFVGQVPRSMDEDDLRPVLEVYGVLEDLVVIRDKLTGAHRGCAFASFFARDAADKAIEELHNKVTLPNSINPLQVRPAEGQAGASQEHKLFIGMIPKSADESAIRAVFAPFGAIEEVYILRHPTTGISKGCAFLKFKDRQSALDAIQQVNGVVTMERGTSALVVKFADSRRQRLQRARNMAAAAAAYWPLPPPQAAAVAGLPFPQLQQLQQQYMQQMQAFDAQTSVNVTVSAPASPTNSFMYYNPYGFAGQGGYGMNTHGIGGLNGMNGMGFDVVPGTSGMMSPTATTTIGSPSSAAAAAAAVLHGMDPTGGGNGGNGAGAGASVSKPARASSQLEGPVGANLFIYHLPHDLTDADLATAFAPFGSVISAKVYMDKITGESKGFGFVSYDSAEAADAAIASMNGFQIGSKRLKVQHKRVHHHQHHQQHQPQQRGDYGMEYGVGQFAAQGMAPHPHHPQMGELGDGANGAGSNDGEEETTAEEEEQQQQQQGNVEQVETGASAGGEGDATLAAAVHQLRIDV